MIEFAKLVLWNAVTTNKLAYRIEFIIYSLIKKVTNMEEVKYPKACLEEFQNCPLQARKLQLNRPRESSKYLLV